MEFDLDLGQWIVIGLSAFLFIWYFTAQIFNRRRGLSTYRWLYRAMEQVGQVVYTDWIGSSNAGARLLVDKATKPFRRVEAVYLLEPREFLPYWVFSRTRGKRDEVVFKITLRSTPRQRIEVESQHRSHRMQAPAPDEDRAPESLLSYNDFNIRVWGQEDIGRLDGLKALLDVQGTTIQKISLRSEAPHLELHLELKSLLSVEPPNYLAGWQKWLTETS